MRYFISMVRHVEHSEYRPIVYYFARQDKVDPPVLSWIYIDRLGVPRRISNLPLSETLELHYAHDVLKWGGRCTFLARHNKKIKLRV